MNVVGIDCGAKFVKALVLEGDKVKAKSSVLSGFDQKAAAEEALGKVLKEAGQPLSKDEVTEKVLAKRLVKKATINLALMDKSRFSKGEGGKYSLAE